MSSKNDTRTLAEIAGTTRGLSKLTLGDIKALAKGEAPAKVVVAKPASEFYEKVIVAGREARQAHHKSNAEAAAWMREKGLVPTGTAWTAVKNGERSIKALKAMNEADGLKPKTKGSTGAQPEARTKVTTKGSTVNASQQHATVTERDIEAEVAILMTQGGFTEADARSILG